MIARSWLLVVAFVLVLVQCSQANSRSVYEVLHAGYPFSITIPVPEFYGAETTFQELQGRKPPFITSMEMKNGSIHLEGLSIQGDSNETLELSVGSQEHASNISVHFSVEDPGVTPKGCELYPAAEIYTGLLNHSRDRYTVLARRQRILTYFDYPTEFVKVVPTIGYWCIETPNCENWNLHLMATDNCPLEQKAFDVFSTVQRLVRLGKRGILYVLNDDSKYITVDPTTEFYERFGDIGKHVPSAREPTTTASSEESITSESTKTFSTTAVSDESAKSSSPEESTTTEVTVNNTSTTASSASHKASSGSSATMPLFTVTVFLAAVSIVAMRAN